MAYRQTKTGYEVSIHDGYLYFEDIRQFPITEEHFHEEIEFEGVRSIRVVSLSSNWQQYVYLNGQEFIENINMEFTLRKEKRGNKNHWYAYRRFGGKLHKKYVGDSSQITPQRLIEIARALPAKTSLKKST